MISSSCTLQHADQVCSFCRTLRHREITAWAHAHVLWTCCSIIASMFHHQHMHTQPCARLLAPDLVENAAVGHDLHWGNVMWCTVVYHTPTYDWLTNYSVWCLYDIIRHVTSHFDIRLMNIVWYDTTWHDRMIIYEERVERIWTTRHDTTRRDATRRDTTHYECNATFVCIHANHLTLQTLNAYKYMYVGTATHNVSNHYDVACRAVPCHAITQYE